MRNQNDNSINIGDTIEVEMNDGEKIRGQLVGVPEGGRPMMQGFRFLTKEGELTILPDQYKNIVKVYDDDSAGQSD